MEKYVELMKTWVIFTRFELWKWK